ncbi:MAG: PIN domain-containing protein [Pseudomonadota bacterium]
MSIKDFVDSNIWIYSLIKSSESDQKSKMADQFLDDLGIHVVSSQVVRECLNNLIKKVKPPEEVIRKIITTWYSDCIVHETNMSQLIYSSYLREKYMLSYWDSFIISSAIDANCDCLYTEDMQDGQIIDGKLKIINPFKV